jgi:hypothetical protein
MIPIRKRVYLTILATGLVFGALCAHAVAHADTGLAVASVDGPDDVFSDGRRAGFLWLGLMLGVAGLARYIVARLKPKDGIAPPPGSWRAKIILVATGAATVLTALIDMFAASRGYEPVATAALGAITLYFAAKDDPQRGSKRPRVVDGEEVPT